MTDGKGEKKRINGFMSGVLVLSLSAVIVKIIGLVYKIPMLKLLGSEGMGYFNSAYEIYTLFCTVATTGLPVAMSVMISSGRRGREGQRVFSAAIKLFLLLGVAGSLIMLAIARPFARFLGGEGAVLCIVAIAPTVFLICLSSAYRGFFQGLGKMMPTGVSQMTEAAGKLVLGLLFAYVALSSGAETETVAAFAVLGLTLGTAVSVLYLALTKSFSRHTCREETELCGEEGGNAGGIVFELLRTAIPVTLSAAVISLTKVIDMTMILRRLQALGSSSESAFAAYGNYTTLALPLFGLAPALIGSVAMPLIPALSAAVARGDETGQRRAVDDALRLTALISMPISAGLVIFSRPVLELLFKGETEAIDAAAPLLSSLGLSVTLSCLITVGNAILQAYGSPSIPIVSMLAGSLLKLILAYILIGNPKIGLLGAPISTFFCDLTVNAINFAFICKRMKEMPKMIEVMLKPFLSSLVSVAASRVLYNLIERSLPSRQLATVIAIAVAAVGYIVLSLVFGAIKKEDLKMITSK